MFQLNVFFLFYQSNDKSFLLNVFCIPYRILYARTIATDADNVSSLSLLPACLPANDDDAGDYGCDDDDDDDVVRIYTIRLSRDKNVLTKDWYIDGNCVSATALHSLFTAANEVIMLSKRTHTHTHTRRHTRHPAMPTTHDNDVVHT